MGRRKQITAMILAALFLISGCGGAKQTVRTSEKTEKDGIRSNGFSCVTDYGVLFCGNTDMLYLYDYGAKEAVPFCARPNCRHDSRDCTAKLFEDRAILPVLYENGLYYMKLNGSADAWEYCRADQNGENEKVLTEVSYDVINPLNAILYHGKAYMIGERATVQEDGHYDGSNDVFSVDLQTGETETILTQTFGTDGIALINFEHAENGTAYLYLYGRNITEGFSDGYYALDMETKSITRLENEENSSAGAWGYGRMIYSRINGAQENGFWSYRLDNGETEKLCSCENPGRGLMMKDGFLHRVCDSEYKTGRWHFYEWDTGEDRELQKSDTEEDFLTELAVEADGEELLIGWYGEGEAEGHYLIPAKAFMDGSRDFQFLCTVNQ
ncbi:MULTISPECIES: hypothetical protein [unclassified Candidatus Paralachnospira]|uniref:hypothetical protein n=1 Tax=unclassified Candidatus Paralachnospira TaxID=3099471 RepID=UPI003F90584F